MKLLITTATLIFLSSSFVFAEDFPKYDSTDIAMAHKIIHTKECSKEQKNALEDIFDSADLSAFLQQKSNSQNAAVHALSKAYIICH
ncbi:MAG: hypothetical protein MI749_20930 [Desulfovibrionales bacterium]|nr:hypothetical protein [Desulfovibrionales bacterium]